MSTEATTPGLVEPQGRGEEPLYHFTRIYLLFLQGLFRQFPEGSYRWSDDERLSEIAVTDQVPIPKDRIEQRPHIVTMRGPAQFARLTLDQMQGINQHTGMKRRTDLVSCTMTLCCISKLGPESQRIAWIVMTHIRRFKELLQRAGMHQVGEDVSIGPESPPGSMVEGEPDSEFVMVPVHSPFFFQWTEEVTPADALMLRGIEVHLKTALAHPAATSTQGAVDERTTLSTPTIRGRAIKPVPAEQVYPAEISMTVKT
jgi:hypothetical protein